MTWQTLADGAPDLAAFRGRTAARPGRLPGHVKADGSPRLSPVRPVVACGRLALFTEAASPKVRDLEREGRFALHATVTIGPFEASLDRAIAVP